MKNPVVRIKMNIRRTDGKHRYEEPVMSSNGKLKPQFCLVDGKPEHHPEGIYYLRYLGRDGRRAMQPVGKDAALVMLEKRKKEAELLARKQGLVVEDTQPESTGMTLGEAIAEYMEDQTKFNRPYGTMKEYDRTLRYFEKSCGAKKPLSAITKKDLIDFMVFLRGLGTLSERSVSNLLINVQSFLKTKDISIVIRKNERPKPVGHERKNHGYAGVCGWWCVRFTSK